MNLAKSHHVDVVIYNNPEKHLVTLRKQQKEKVEEIKKKTNYYTTKNLVERYDVPAGAAGGPGANQARQQQGRGGRKSALYASTRCPRTTQWTASNTTK